jgi:acyl-coenzyme A thioesterase PaaI-like protein
MGVAMDPTRSFQEQMPGNHCWGCGPDNPAGLQLRSRWDGNDAVAVWQPRPEHAAGPRDVLFGGIIAALIDCHSICTAYATAFRVMGRPIGSDPTVWYVTAMLQVSYLRPTPLTGPVTLRARVTESAGRRAYVTCSLYADGQECARGEVIAVRVPAARHAAA